MLVYICESMKLHAVAEYWQQVFRLPFLPIPRERPTLASYLTTPGVNVLCRTVNTVRHVHVVHVSVHVVHVPVHVVHVPVHADSCGGRSLR